MYFQGRIPRKPKGGTIPDTVQTMIQLYPHLPGGCTIDNHILSLPDVSACNLIITLTRILFCKLQAILCAVQAQKGFSMQNMGNVPTPGAFEFPLTYIGYKSIIIIINPIYVRTYIHI